MHLHVVKIRLWKATVENDLKCRLKKLVGIHAPILPIYPFGNLALLQRLQKM